MPAKLDIDGTPEQAPRKRGPKPRVESVPVRKEPDDLTLGDVFEKVDDLRASVEVMGEDVLQRLADNAKAAALVSEDDDKTSAATMAQLITVNTQLRDAIHTMVQRYDVSTSLLVGCDRISRQRYDRMTKELSAVIAKHLAEEAKPVVKEPLPTWQVYTAWCVGALVSCLALFGLYFIASVGF
jgi:hypothetical protein